MTLIPISGIGKHVAVPPPAGISQNETLRMVQAAQYYPSLISIAVYGLRFLPAFVKAKQLLSKINENLLKFEQRIQFWVFFLYRNEAKNEKNYVVVQL